MRKQHVSLPLCFSFHCLLGLGNRGVGKNRTPFMFCHGYINAPPDKTNTVTVTIPSWLIAR
jgi:hypothetical protein